MAVKKTGKRRRRRSNLRVFIISLMLVLTVGGLGMIAYSNSTVVSEEEKPLTVVDFGRLEQTLDNTDIPDNTVLENVEIEIESLEQTSTEEVDVLRAENERLYNEAISKGEKVFLVNCVDQEQIKLAFAGDILLDDEYAMMFRYRSRGSDINDTFSATLLERMRNADVFMLNNEFPFSTRGTPTEGKTFTFRANPSNIEMYAQIGVDLVSLANNHAYDYGEQALLDTFSTLEGAGIPYVGAGRNIEEAKKPVYLIANGMKIAVVSATQIERNAVPDTKEATMTNAGVLRCMDPTALLEVIAQAKANSDFVILYIHWGTESQETTDWLQDKQAPIYAEAGVDLIIGDHPHCLQKIDCISGVPVVFSLGNYWFNSKTQNTCLVEVQLTKEGLKSLQFIPCLQENCRTSQLEGAKKEEVLNYMRKLSPNVQIDSEGYVSFP
ncbi:MAG: CapA family protein [Lachnospiraceae bacterium]|nr:CapA family protein [Lachnospiraceae bacterium]